MIYTLCYRLVLILFSHFPFNLLLFLCLPCVGQAHSLTSFVVCQLVRLGNVCDCCVGSLSVFLKVFCLFKYFNIYLISFNRWIAIFVKD